MRYPGWDRALWCDALSGTGARPLLAGGGGRPPRGHRGAPVRVRLEHGADELAAAAAPVLGHRCDNPLCQRIGPGHVVRSSPRENRREWAARRALAGDPLTDRPGARGRARELRAALRADQPGYDLVAGAGLGSDGLQLPLWAAGRG